MHDELVRGLRDLADFIEENPDLPLGEYADVLLSEYIYDDYDEEYDAIEGSALEKMRSLARKLKPVKKEYTSGTFSLVKKFGERVSLEFSTHRRNVCERIVVEKIEHPASVREAWVEEKVEWVCNDPLLK